MTSSSNPAARRTDLKALLIRLTGAPFHSIAERRAQALALPASKMRKQTRRQPNRCLLLFRFAPPDHLPIKDTVFEIDPASTNGGLV